MYINMNLSVLLFLTSIILSNSYPFRFKFPTKRNFSEIFSTSDYYNSTAPTFIDIDIHNKILNDFDEIVSDINLFHFMLNF